MKQSKYLAATTSFQTGLTHDPENPDLKSQYVVASKLAEKEGSKGGFDTKLMALMMELRQNSWSVRAWANNQKFIHYLGFGDDSGGSTVAVISKKTKDNDAVVSITEVKAAFAASAGKNNEISS